MELPRFVIKKPLKSGLIAFYWNLPGIYKDAGCTIHIDQETKLGTDVEVMKTRAEVLNDLFDAWDAVRLGEAEATAAEQLATYGTVEWLFRTFKGSKAWRARVSARTAPDYERTMAQISNIITKKGDRIGDRFIKAITPISADKIFDMIRDTPVRKGKKIRPRAAEKAVSLARYAWKVVYRLHPNLFNEKIPNPWVGVAMDRRTKATKPAATREQVYTFAWGAVDHGYPEAAAAAVICFEWLQRPENVLTGYVRWSDYRAATAPNAIRIEHHKTGAMVLHPLEETVDGERVQFYAEAEEILAKVPRLGLGIVLRNIEIDGKTRVQKRSIISMAQLVRRLRGLLDLPETFTLDACRHGGMTELEEAELTDGQGRALSAHKSRAYEGYAKRTEIRALAATRKRYAHVIAQSLAEEQVAAAHDAAATAGVVELAADQPREAARPVTGRG